jgi:hypothetical protein
MPNDREPDAGKPDYVIGYCKPPKGTRFVKGRSGNPKGKPKGSRNLATLLTKTVNEAVIVHENGRRKTITKLEAMAGNVWTYRGANSLGRETDEGNLLTLHPTVKPVAMVAEVPSLGW